jgi:hypothetical protein
VQTTDRIICVYDQRWVQNNPKSLITKVGQSDEDNRAGIGGLFHYCSSEAVDGDHPQALQYACTGLLSLVRPVWQLVG